MENASKALIIAGAILLSILIISLGIMVYNNAKNTVGNANLSKQEIQAFNSQWEQYEGSNKTASEVKTMIQAVIASNAAEEKNGSGRYVDIASTQQATDPDTPTTKPTISASTTSSITNASTYTMQICYGSNGLVSAIAYYTPTTTTT